MACLKHNLSPIEGDAMSAFGEDLFLKDLEQRKATLGTE